MRNKGKGSIRGKKINKLDEVQKLEEAGAHAEGKSEMRVRPGQETKTKTQGLLGT